VAPWSAVDLDAHGLTVEQVTTQAWWVGADGRTEGGHRAVARALRAVGGAWGVAGRALGWRALAPLARPGYALVARYRHRLPGGTAACRPPTSPPGPPER
jgi:predicted DCC family thiol-disulfide oxidoreductase YuxK